LNEILDGQKWHFRQHICSLPNTWHDRRLQTESYTELLHDV